MRSQALGLAEAVGLPIVEKRIVRAAALVVAAGRALADAALGARSVGRSAGAALAAPCVGCGRRSIGAALAVKRLSAGGAILAAYVQNPEWGRAQVRSGRRHAARRRERAECRDRAARRCIAVTPERLAAARAEWRTRLAPSGAAAARRARRRRQWRLPADGRDRRATRPHPASTRMPSTASRGDHAVAAHRRGGASACLRTRSAAKDWAWLWDEPGENPYFGILALADRLIVTGEFDLDDLRSARHRPPGACLPLEGQGSATTPS